VVPEKGRKTVVVWWWCGAGDVTQIPNTTITTTAITTAAVMTRNQLLKQMIT